VNDSVGPRFANLSNLLRRVSASAFSASMAKRLRSSRSHFGTRVGGHPEAGRLSSSRQDGIEACLLEAIGARGGAPGEVRQPPFTHRRRGDAGDAEALTRRSRVDPGILKSRRRRRRWGVLWFHRWSRIVLIQSPSNRIHPRSSTVQLHDSGSIFPRITSGVNLPGLTSRAHRLTFRAGFIADSGQPSTTHQTRSPTHRWGRHADPLAFCAGQPAERANSTPHGHGRGKKCTYSL
jgi:hypothetical protein